MMTYWRGKYYVRYDWFDILDLTRKCFSFSKEGDLIDNMIYMELDCLTDDDLIAAIFPAYPECSTACIPNPGSLSQPQPYTWLGRVMVRLLLPRENLKLSGVHSVTDESSHEMPALEPKGQESEAVTGLKLDEKATDGRLAKRNKPELTLNDAIDAPQSEKYRSHQDARRVSTRFSIRTRGNTGSKHLPALILERQSCNDYRSRQAHRLPDLRITAG